MEVGDEAFYEKLRI